MGTRSQTLTMPTGRSFFTFLRRNVDGYYYSVVDQGFLPLNLSTADEATRAEFRIDYTESLETPGEYSWELTTTDYLDGSYTSRNYELDGTDEYLISTSNFRLNGGNLAYNNDNFLTHRVYSADGITVFGYLVRASDSMYYNVDSADFADLDLLTATDEEIATFRVAYTEDPAGTYQTLVDAALFDSGVYTITAYTNINGLPEDIDSKTVTVVAGAIARGSSVGLVGVNHDTGGVDALRFVAANGDPIPEAEIVIANINTSTDPAGVTYTDSEGRWVSKIFLPMGQTYVVTFQKSGEYGPSSATIVL